MNIDFIMISFGIGGAETRISKVISKLSTNQTKCTLVINKSLLDKSKNRLDFLESIEKINANGKVKSLYDFKGIKYVAHIFCFLSALVQFLLTKSSQIHLSLGAIYLAPFSIFLKNKKIFIEVTSPDVANKLIRIKRIIPNDVIFISVSDTVDNKIKSVFTSSKRFTYPIPFYLEKDIISNEKKKLITFSARFIKRKNPILFLESILALSYTRNDFKVIVMGNGPLMDQVMDLSDKINVQVECVVGFNPEPMKVLSESLIFVSLIEPDNYPSQSILEAMNCSNALLISKNGTSSNFIDNTEPNGILVELDKNEIANTLSNLLDNTTLTQNMGLRSRSLITKKFNSVIFTNYIQHIFHEKN